MTNRHRLSWFRVAAAATAGVLVGIGTAAAAALPDQVLITNAAVIHEIPPGALPEAAPAGEPVVVPVRIPIGRDALDRLKDSDEAASGTEGAAGDETGVAETAQPGADSEPTVEGPIKQERGVTRCNAQSANGFAPSDSHGAVGPTNFVTVSNVLVQVQAKSGCGVVDSETLISFFSSVGVPSGTTLFDPRVIYDDHNRRFFLTAESENDSNSDQYQYFAVSKNSSGKRWYVYRVTLSKGPTRFCKTDAGSFWDYPSSGSTRQRWFIVANDFGTSVTGGMLDIDKTPTLTGAAATIACFADLPFNLAPPIVLDKATVSTFLSPGSGGGTTIKRLNLTEGATATSDTLAVKPDVNITSWSAPPNAAQPNGATLDTLDGRFQSASIQSRGLLWNVHSVAASTTAGSRSRLRLYKLSQSTGTTLPLMVLDLHTKTGNGLDHVFNGSFATASGALNAPAFLAASRTIPTITTGNKGFASALIFAGLNSSTSTGTDWVFHTVAVSKTQFTGCSPCRWGDYSATQVDPSARGSGWGWNQIVTGSSQFSWRITAGKVDLTLPTAPVVAKEE
jgi:hypothetical protein